VSAGSAYASNLAPNMEDQKPLLSADIVNIIGIDEMSGILRVDIQVQYASNVGIDPCTPS
jgi:hypothetical protein